MSSGSVCSYEDLDVWKLGMDLAELVYGATERFPSTERFGLTSQARRAVASIPANIAEGWGRGRTSAQSNFLRIARGSLYELRTLTTLATRLHYLDANEAAPIHETAETLGRKLNAYLAAVEGAVVRESNAAYDCGFEKPCADATDGSEQPMTNNEQPTTNNR
jgi:four helix bundle protein